MIRVELHCHTCYSKDSLVRLLDLDEMCQKKGIQRLVVTDHNDIQGAELAVRLNPRRFIVGEEIMTSQGELIGVFIKELIPASLSSLETVRLLREQGAFIAVAHPFDTLRAGHWELHDLNEIADKVDAIEVFNSRCMLPKSNLQAKQFARQYHLLPVVGSDSHSLAEIGTATLSLPEFSDSESLKLSLQSATQRLHLSPPWVHIYSRYASWRKKSTH